MTKDIQLYDAIIVGGGPAGLSAALVLGRANRRVLVIDAGQGRNAVSKHLNGYLTRDGIHPARFRRSAHEELSQYPVEKLRRTAVAARCLTPGRPGAARFEVRLESGRRVRGRTLLLATGVADVLPSIPDCRQWYGKGMFHCPYCDGWQIRGQPVIAWGRGKHGVGLAMALRTWTPRVTVCTDGGRVSPEQQSRLRALGITWHTQRIARLFGRRGRLAGAELADGRRVECAALFFNTRQVQRSPLAWELGCRATPKGGVHIDRRGRTGVDGLFLAGDASKEVQFAITAAADGARAAVAINRLLQDEECAQAIARPLHGGSRRAGRSSGRR